MVARLFFQSYTEKLECPQGRGRYAKEVGVQGALGTLGEGKAQIQKWGGRVGYQHEL